MSSGTTTRSPGARILDADAPRPPRGARASEAVRSLLSGMWVGIELAAAPLLLLAVVVGAILVADPPSGGSGWARTADVAATVWVAGLGVPVTIGQAAFTLVPLGVTLVVALAGVQLGRRVLRPGGLAFASAVVVHAVLATAAVLVLAHAAASAALTAPLTGAGTAVVVLGIGALTRPDGPTVRERLDHVAGGLADRYPQVPGPLLDGLRRGASAALVAVLLVVVASGLLVVVWGISGRSAISDVLRALQPGTASGLLLGVAQLAVVPNLVVWALAWLAGPGFGIGDGSLYAPHAHVEGALPLVPVVGALPGAGWVNAAAQASLLVVVAAGVVAGVFSWRAHAYAGGTTWTGLVTSSLTTAVGAGLLVAALVSLASGAVGPGVLAHVGARTWPVAGLVAVEVAVGVVLATAWKLLDVGARVRAARAR